MASIDVLKKSLAANGLPTSGNKDQMLQRLIKGQGDKRKKATREVDATDEVAKDFTKYEAKERAVLVAQGLTDEAMIRAEILRRFQTLQSVKKPTVSKMPKTDKTSDTFDNVVVLPAKMSDENAKLANLFFVSPTVDGRYMYMSSKPKAAPDGNFQRKKPVAKTDVEESVAKKDFKEEEPVLDEATWSAAVNVVRERLFDKAKLDNMKLLCKDFGIESEVKDHEDKDHVADKLTEQLLYKTDDEAEEEDAEEAHDDTM